MSIHNNKKSGNGQSIEGQKGGVVHFWKMPGETLAAMLCRFREEQHLSHDEKMTYAGRLDPMAEGIVPMLVGDARFQKDHMLGAAKTYEMDIVLGIGTDTGDMLGLPTADPALNLIKSDSEIQEALTTLAQTISLPYPNYSSIPVQGKPLFMHARANNKVVLPIKNVTIYSLELLGTKEVLLEDLVKQSIEVIKKVQGDFRQEEIMQQWQQLIEADGDKQIQIVTIRTTVSSGTYMRSLAEKMGKLLKVPALASKIIRTKVVEK
jgi:tRNA pseudouridine(55) synthase